MVDQKCWDLAEHFLSDVKGHTKEDIQELAELFQRQADDFCSALEDIEQEREDKRP